MTKLNLTPPGLFPGSVQGTHINSGSVFGASSEKLYNFVPYYSSNYMIQIANHDDTSFSALINGAPAGSNVVYDTVTGNENSIAPTSAAWEGKLVLHNTTRGNSALISTVNTGTNTITLTDSVPGTWANNDSIQVNSTTCNTGAPPYYFDVDVSGIVPSTCVAIYLRCNPNDIGGPVLGYSHPYATYAAAKQMLWGTDVTGFPIYTYKAVPVVSQTICIKVNTPDTSSTTSAIRCFGWWEEATV